jgi:phosphoribosylformylglycinamidine synthase
VLGICNGAQVLVEAGLVPGLRPGHVEMALAPNRAPRRQGYLCRWVRVRAERGPGSDLWCSAWPANEVVPIPIAHGEGRFETADPGVRARIETERLALLRYCGRDGRPAERYPDDPNGALLQAAGITNPAGNVLALMPHPERASWLRQVPLDWEGAWGDRRRRAVGTFTALEEAGPGRFLFESLARHLGATRGAGVVS